EGKPRSVALRLIRNRGGWYDTKVLDTITNHFAPALNVLTGAEKPDAAKSVRKRGKGALEALQALAQKEAEGPQTVAINFGEILIGDVLASDLCASDGSLLLSAGYTVTQPVL